MPFFVGRRAEEREMKRQKKYRREALRIWTPMASKVAAHARGGAGGQNEPQAKRIGHELTWNEVQFGQPYKALETHRVLHLLSGEVRRRRPRYRG
jgi:hypothetical protein